MAGLNEPEFGRGKSAEPKDKFTSESLTEKSIDLTWRVKKATAKEEMSEV